MRSSATYFDAGKQYNQSAILTPDNKLDKSKLAEIGLPRYTTTYATSQLCYNVSLGAAITHLLVWHWPELKRGALDFVLTLRRY